MVDEFNKESARERAARRWHNANIQKQSAMAHEPESIYTKETDAQLNTLFSRFKADVREIIESHNKQLLAQYVAAIRHRKYKLLKEKLRRLRLIESKVELNDE